MNELTNLYKLLSDETRLRILVLLYLDQLCVCQISGITGAPQPRISKNLAKLRDMHYVEDHRQEKYVFYRLKSLDGILKTNLDHIIANIDCYPTLKHDIEKLSSKATYKES